MTHAHIYVDLSRNHNTGVAIANPASTAATIAIKAYQTDGITSPGIRQGTLLLPGGGHDAKFADQLIPGLPTGFKGVLDISSGVPFTPLTLRSLINERDEFLMTSFPVADANRAAPSPIVFPHIVEGSGYAMEFILIGSGRNSSAALNFYNEDGTPLNAGR